MWLFVCSGSSWVQTCETGDQLYSNTYPNNECSLHGREDLAKLEIEAFWLEDLSHMEQLIQSDDSYFS